MQLYVIQKHLYLFHIQNTTICKHLFDLTFLFLYKGIKQLFYKILVNDD